MESILVEELEDRIAVAGDNTVVVVVGDRTVEDTLEMTCNLNSL